MSTFDDHSVHWQRTFFAIWGGQALSRMGSAIAHFALVWWLTDLTGSAAVLASASAAATIPQVILGPLAGAYVDRWNRRVTMMVSDGIIALLSLWLAWLFWSDALEIWHVYVILIGRSMGNIFHFPATQAATAMLVPRRELPRVHGLNQTLNGAVQVLGPALGALALAVLALHQVMLVDVVTACSAILPLLFVRIPEPERAAKSSAGSVWNDVLEGFRYIRSLPGVMTVIAVAVVLNFVGTPTWTLLPLYVRDVFGGSAGDLGLIQSGFGVGLILGGLALSVWGGRLKGNRAIIAMGGVAISQIGVFGVASAPANMLWMVGASWTLFATFNAIANGTFAAVLQGTVAPEMQGRVQSAVSSGVTMAIPLGLAVSAPVVGLLGLRFWYYVSATVAISGALWAMTSRQVRLLDTVGSREAPGPVAELATEAEG